MKRLSYVLSFILGMFLMLMLGSTSVNAKTYMGKITIKVGESYTVSAVPTSGYTASGYWTKSNNHFVITASGSYNCVIKGNTVGSATLSYWGSVAPANSWNTYTYDYYWDVEVTGNGGSSGGGSGSISNSHEEDDIEEPTDDWGKSGNYTISWYNKNQSEFTLSSNKELAGMAYLINNGYTEFEGCTIKLANDIDLSEKKWKAPSNFKGTFDGQGHKISGVFIGTDDDTQLNFGFWKTLSDATIVNLNLEGTAKYEVKKSTNSTAHVGGMAGEVSSGSLIQNCKVNMDIYFRRGKASSQVSAASSGFEETIRNRYTGSYVGGIVGWLKGNIKNCVNLGSIRHYVRETSWVSQGVILGGIAGYCSDGTRIEYCENLSPLIKVVESNVSDDFYSYKWISGISYNGNPLCCRSVVGEMSVDVTSHDGVPVLYLSGISASGRSTNCYSVTPLIVLNTKNSKAKVVYGGIAAYKGYAYEPNYSFSNNDVQFSMDYSRTIEDGLDGSEAFSAEQMKTAAFAEELNMYSILELDGPIWKHVEGSYPYINSINEATAIHEVKMNKAHDSAVYNLSGQQLSAPQKGINIIGGKKVVVK